MTIATEIVRVHLEHPDWHAQQIADVVGCDYSYVRSVKQTHHLPIPAKSHGRPAVDRSKRPKDKPRPGKGWRCASCGKVNRPHELICTCVRRIDEART